MTDCQRRAGASRSGFTLLEMLVVLTILALIATVALPNLMHPSDRRRLDAAAQGLLGAIRLTRATAITRNAEMALEIDVDRRTYYSPAVRARSFGPDMVVRLTVAGPKQSTASRGGFRFFPDGSSTGGDVELLLGGKEARLCVDWLTGAVRQGGAC
jgi:general secretion pathway protein H